MNTVKTFTNENLGSVRVTKNQNGEWFVAKDVCDILELTNVSLACSRLDDDEKGICSTYTPGGEQEMLCVNEYGLWQLVLGSRKPQAKDFKRWLTHEVIPAIRKNGGYIEGQEYLSEEDKAKLESEVKGLRVKVQSLLAQNKCSQERVKHLVRIIEHDYTGDFDRKQRDPWAKVNVYDADTKDYEDLQEDMEIFNVSEYSLFEEVKAIINAAKSTHIDKSAAKHLVGELDRLFVERNAV